MRNRSTHAPRWVSLELSEAALSFPYRLSFSKRRHLFLSWALLWYPPWREVKVKGNRDRDLARGECSCVHMCVWEMQTKISIVQPSAKQRIGESLDGSGISVRLPGKQKWIYCCCFRSISCNIIRSHLSRLISPSLCPLHPSRLISLQLPSSHWFVTSSS